MERREAGEEFPHYDEAEIVVKYHMVDLTQPSSHDAILPTRDVRIVPTLTVLDLKKKIAKVPMGVVIVCLFWVCRSGYEKLTISNTLSAAVHLERRHFTAVDTLLDMYA